MSELKDIFLDVAKSSKHPWRDYTDYACDKLNRAIRNELEKEFNRTPSEKEKVREEEIKKIAAEEKAKWESDKAEFESNPLHWSNNKRRRNGLQTLRGSVNKNRNTKFHSFKPTPRMFYMIEDMLDEMLPKALDKHFGQFVDVKDLALGDAVNTYSI